jgi:hypothetical protein
MFNRIEKMHMITGMRALFIEALSRHAARPRSG